MAAPNLLNLTTAIGVTTYANVTSAAANVVTNPAGSSKSFRLNSVMFTSTGPNTTVTAYINSPGRVPANTYLVDETLLVANAIFVALDKNTVVYIQEGESLFVQSLANNAAHAIITYEDLS